MKLATDIHHVRANCWKKISRSLGHRSRSCSDAQCCELHRT